METQAAGPVAAPGLAELELQFKQREKELQEQHERETTELKQELFSQSVKVCATKCRRHLECNALPLNA